MRLRKCECGKTPKMTAGIYGDELRIVECECGKETLQYSDGNDAAGAWNKMIRDKPKETLNICDYCKNCGSICIEVKKDKHGKIICPDRPKGKA